ncbi:polysaccharide lyase family 8 super-sandwich domain-containing protein [Flavobacterium sp. ST-87]|uniref:Polysaccharide lyase family 8 super-sandwich domain-containing protein n=1 Tax=Flavobacterium plantiphilum TaxID=3163297 RepID=A0ABW8XN27_9FLAO
MNRILKKSLLIGFLFLLNGSVFAQLTEINALKTKYVNWMLGENADYTNPQLLTRYKQFLVSGNSATTRDFSDYNFASPGTPWDFKNFKHQALFTNLGEKHLASMVFLYQIKGPKNNPNPAYHRKSLRDSIFMIFDYIKAKGVSGKSDFNYEISGQDVSARVALRTSAYATSILLMKDELKAVGTFKHHMEALNTLTAYIAPDFGTKIGIPGYPTNPGMNSDMIRAGSQQRLCYIFAQEDSSKDKVINMEFFRRFYNTALQISGGWHDCIKPDFITFHHRGVYANSYGLSALLQASVLNMILKSTVYELDKLAQSNLKNAIMNYAKFSTDFTMPRGITGRFPKNTSFSDLLPAFANLFQADPIGNLDAGQEFKRLWNLTSEETKTELIKSSGVSLIMVNGLAGMQIMNDVLSKVSEGKPIMEGHFGFPYAGLSVHKYKGYQASVKGTSKNVWHYENSDKNNLYGQYSSAGAMELLTLGVPKTPETNGLTLEGYDWAHVAGTTVANVPFTEMAKSEAREFNGKAFLAHASLDNQGVFAIDYKDYNLDTEMTALKSYFFFNDKILCLGSDIKNTNGTHPIHTTLFQTSYGTNNKSIVNGKTETGNDYIFDQTSGGVWATDANGNGYVLPKAVVNNNNVVITRGKQTSFNENSKTATSTGNFTKAYINHGVAPTSATYRYAVWLKGETNTKDLADNFSKYFNVIQQDEKAHVAQYVPDSIFGYVVFDSSAKFNADVVKNVDKPSVIMTQKITGGNLKISLTNPNLGLLKEDENPDWNTISKTPSFLYRKPVTEEVNLNIIGKWILKKAVTGVTTTVNGTDTKITFSTVNGKTMQIELVKAH